MPNQPWVLSRSDEAERSRNFPIKLLRSDPVMAVRQQLFSPVQLVERFKTDRMNTPTKKGTARQPATVNRELNLLSSAFSLAVLYDKAEFNPCSKVDLFPLDNLPYRYLLPDEEPRLMAELKGPRAHLKPGVIVALATGMRLGEQLRMKRRQVDFLRNIVTARKTKNGRPRDIPMNDEVRETLAELCKDKRPDDYVFVSPKDSDERQREVKKGFHTACRLAGIEGLIWKDLRSDFRHSLSRGRMRCVHDRSTPGPLRCSPDYALREVG